MAATTDAEPATKKAAEPPLTPRPPRLIAIAAVATLALVGADLASKAWAEGALSSERAGEAPEVCSTDEGGYIRYQRVRRPGIEIIEDVFELEYAENCGAAFGLGNDWPVVVRTAIFGLAAVAATIFLFLFFVQGKGGPLYAWSVPLVVSGALGNLFDRVRYGYVVDFIHFHWRDAFDYPTFNVADITITIGVVMLLLDGFRADPASKPASDAKGASDAKPSDDAAASDSDEAEST